MIIIAVICGTVTGGYFALVQGVPQLEEIKGYVPISGTKVFADDNTLIGEFKIEKGVHVGISNIPESVIRAIISVEDARFWLHKGIDYIAIVRAISRDIVAGRIKEGASTITQQLAKVVFLSPDRTILRKLKEATLAYRIENIDVDFDGMDYFDFDSNKYLFFCIKLEDYRKFMKRRSPKWQTVTLPAEKFRDCAVHINDFLL